MRFKSHRSSFAPARRPQTALLDLQRQIYRETRRGPRPAPHLMTWLLDRRNLQAAWDRVQSADGAQTPGADGQTCRSIEPKLAAWLSQLADDLYHDRYQPHPPRWVMAPKSQPGRFRKLGILNIRDRVVQAALKQVLEPVLEPVFLPCSFGFRPGRSVAGALAEAVRLLDAAAGGGSPLRLAASVDVANCFDTIDHRILLKELGEYAADAELDRLLEKIVAAGGSHAGRLWRKRRRGLVQGSALSPLLCNLYLHSVDRDLMKLSDDRHGSLHVLRYADNLLVLAQNRRAARLALQTIQQRLRRLRQRLGEKRPRALAMQDGIGWLGVRIRPRRFSLEDKKRFGYLIPERKVESMIARLAEMTASPSETIDADVFNLERWIVAINRQLRDWRGAYLYADNSAEVFRTLDDFAQFKFGHLLRRITGERMSRIRKQYRVRLPRGFWSWRVGGVRMSVLSSLAPHCASYLTRRPSWMTGGAASFAPAVEPFDTEAAEVEMDDYEENTDGPEISPPEPFSFGANNGDSDEPQEPENGESDEEQALPFATYREELAPQTDETEDPQETLTAPE